MKFDYKHIWLIAYPIMISLLMEHLINITDTAFLGRVGEIELGASALAGVYYMAIYMLAFGFSIGVQILIARRNGEGRHTEIGKIFQTGACALITLAIVMFFFSRLFTVHILKNLVSSDQILNAAISYLDWRVYGFFFSFIAILFRAFYIGITKTYILTLNSIIMVLSNVVFNYILIFGKLGFPAMGIAGAAIGSSLAELISMLFYVVYTWIKIDRHKYNLFKRMKLDLVGLKHVWQISSWTMLQSFLFPSQWFLFFISIEHLGARPLAIANIIRSINTCFFMLIFAFADTTSSIVSNMLGEGEGKDEIIKVCKRVIKLTYIVGLPLIILTGIFPYTILRIYTNSQDLINAAYPTMYVMLANFILSVPALILFNTVAGTGNTFNSMKIMLKTMIAYSVYVIIMVIWIKANIAVCWTTEYIYAGMLLTLSIMFLKRAKWDNKI